MNITLTDNRKMKALEDRIAVLEREMKEDRHHYRMRYEERLYEVVQQFTKALQQTFSLPVVK